MFRASPSMVISKRNPKYCLDLKFSIYVPTLSGIQSMTNSAWNPLYTFGIGRIAFIFKGNAIPWRPHYIIGETTVHLLGVLAYGDHEMMMMS